ncbi:MAG TPA: hypothetical protein VFG89_00030 [Coriobacteriia bacterium]|nr:hypothetical protein [Coriobacteriia bacterium]
MQTREWSKPLLVGAIIGFVLFAAILGYAIVRQKGSQGRALPARVAIVLVSRDASDSPTAQAIAVSEGGKLAFVSPETPVTVPGTSARRLADAYSFGGGALLVSLLPEDAKVDEGAYLAIPEKAWLSTIDPQGFKVDVPQDVEIFDGSDLVSLKAGEQTLTPTEVAALFRALPFVDEDLREPLREQLARKVLAALGGAQSVTGIESGLSADAIRQLIGTL